MLIDSAPVRRKARRAYEKVLSDLDLAKAEAERFEKEDKPEFAKWMSANFGALLTEIRGLQERLFHAQELVNEVQQEFFYGDYRSIHKAFQAVMHRRDHPEEAAEEKAKQEGESEKAEFEGDFENSFGKMEEEFWEKMGVDPEELKRGRKTVPPKENGRLKDIYRKLVRLLHPDKGAKQTAKEIEWWHQVQEAYEVGNLEQLELILTLVEMEDKGTKDVSISVLGQLTAEFKRSLNALKRKIAAFKKDVAWNFSRLSDMSTLLVRMRSNIEGERVVIKALLEKYERQVQVWESAAAAPRKRVRVRRNAPKDEEWF